MGSPEVRVNKLIAGVCLGAIAAALMVAALPNAHTPVATNPDGLVRGEASTSAMASAEAERARAISTSSASSNLAVPGTEGGFAEMRRMLSTADNYRSFVSTALNRPADGGRFYALVATETCIRVKALQGGNRAGSTQEQSQFVLQSAEALDQMSQRCDGLAEQFGGLGILIGKIVDRKSGGSEDPLMRAQSQLSDSHEDPREAIKRARALADPNLMAMTLLTKAEQLLERAKPFGDAQLDEDLVGQAAYTAACEIRGDCINSLEVAIECISRGCASPDMREIVLAKIPSRQDREQYQRLRQWFLSSVR